MAYIDMAEAGDNNLDITQTRPRKSYTIEPELSAFHVGEQALVVFSYTHPTGTRLVCVLQKWGMFSALKNQTPIGRSYHG